MKIRLPGFITLMMEKHHFKREGKYENRLRFAKVILLIRSSDYNQYEVTETITNGDTMKGVQIIKITIKWSYYHEYTKNCDIRDVKHRRTMAV